MGEREHPITGKVAQLLNEREIALNVGKQQGVEQGMVFAVFEKPMVIKDPDTGRELDTLQRVKLKVRVSVVKDRICVARTFRTERTLVRQGREGQVPAYLTGTASLAASLFSQEPEYVTKVQTIRKDDYKGTFEHIRPEDSVVQVGDPVEEVPQRDK